MLNAGVLRKKAVEVSWYARFWNAIRGTSATRPPSGPGPRGPDATAEFVAPGSMTLHPGNVKLRVGVVSTVGNVREHNEDNFYVPGQPSVVDGGSRDGGGEISAGASGGSGGAGGGDSLSLFIVADGMGGQQAGEEASRMAVELIPRALSRRLAPGGQEPRAVQTAIREAVAEANHEILGCSGTVPEFSNMGTTVVLTLFRDERVYVAGIGDSRAYRLREHALEQLTKDHSLADALGEAGTISKDEVPNHKYKNILYLFLGSRDARGGPEEVRVLDARPGDRFLLASDGLTGVVSDAELARVLEATPTPQEAARILKDLALDNDSRDNVTCLVIHVVDESGSASAGSP